jgi:hypothetical protein
MGFEYASVLFRNDIHGSTLFRYYFSSASDLGEVLTFPSNLGLIGECMMRQKEVTSLKGDKDPRYLNEIDNPLNIQTISNLIICPMVD